MPAPQASALDQPQICQRAFDEANGRWRVDIGSSISLSSAEVIITHTDDSIRIGDGTNLVTTTTVGSDVGLDVSLIGVTTTTVGADIGLDVNILGGTVTGTFTQAGLFVAMRVTTQDVDDTAAQPIPAVALVGRNSMAVRNTHSVNKIYVGPSNVTADTVLGTTSGWEVGPGEDYQVDIQDNIILYARCETGQTVRVKIAEYA